MIEIREILADIKASNDWANKNNVSNVEGGFMSRPLKDNSAIEALFKKYDTISVADFITVCKEIEDHSKKCKFISIVLKDCVPENFSDEDNNLIKTQIMPMIDSWSESIMKKSI